MTIDALLSRLPKVKQTATGRWISPCPAHDDRTPSLSIRVLSDGQILLKDFGGCETQAVLDALGMTFADLYPERLGHHVRPTKSRIPASDLLLIVEEETLVASILAADFQEKRSISEADCQRLAVCSQRLGKAVVELRR